MFVLIKPFKENKFTRLYYIGVETLTEQET